jgi:hypothetical protein
VTRQSVGLSAVTLKVKVGENVTVGIYHVIHSVHGNVDTIRPDPVEELSRSVLGQTTRDVVPAA